MPAVNVSPGSALPAIAAALVLQTGAAAAQTCAAPIQLHSGPPTAIPGNTCGAANALPTIGPIPSPHPDIVYQFFGHPALVGQFQVTGQFPGAVYLLAGTCSASSMPIAAESFGPGPAQIPATGLGLQPYFLVVTGADGSPPDTCGAFQLFVDVVLPDPVFGSGFE